MFRCPDVANCDGILLYRAVRTSLQCLGVFFWYPLGSTTTSATDPQFWLQRTIYGVNGIIYGVRTFKYIYEVTRYYPTMDIDGSNHRAFNFDQPTSYMTTCGTHDNSSNTRVIEREHPIILSK